MTPSENYPRLYLLAAAALGTLCVSLAFMVGDIGFLGDDWWQFSWPYWHSFPSSIWEYAKESRRPVEGLYTVLSFEAFGFNRIPYTLIALSVLAASGFVMGACLRKAFPARVSMSVASMFFVFLLPHLSNLTYMFCTDNSRISGLLFWLSVLAFQRWAGAAPAWPGLALPLVLYLMAALTYENTTFLIFSVPLFVWPIHVRDRSHASSAPFLVRLFVAIGVGFACYVLARFLLLSGGAVGHAAFPPSLHMIIKYLSNLLVYCWDPIQKIFWDMAGWIWAVAAAVSLAGLLYLAADRDSEVPEDGTHWNPGALYVALLGIVVAMLGMLPYLLAGYNSTVGFTSQSRIYSSAGFGVAIILGLAATGWKNRRFLTATKIVAVILAALMAAFAANLRLGWQEAAEKRTKLCASLVKQVPDAVAGTTFLFLDLQWYIPTSTVDGVAVFQGVDGLPAFIRILYGKKDLNAYFLYLASDPLVDEEGRRAAVSKDGLIARGCLANSPVPLDSLLILQRKECELVLLDRISANDRVAAIKWEGVSSICSNYKLLLPATQSEPSPNAMRHRALHLGTGHE